VSRRSLRSNLAVLFAATAAVTLFLGVLTGLALVRLDRATTQRVDIYGPALLETATLTSAYINQETGVRGYLLSGQQDFLTPYRNGKASEAASLRHLRALLAGRPDILRRLAAVNAAAQRWRTASADPAIKAAPDTTRAQDQVAVETGKQRFDAIRASLRDLRIPIRQARDHASRDLSGAQRQLRTVLLAALLGLVVLGGVAWRSLRTWVVTPLSDLGGQVDEVEAGDLDRVVGLPDVPREIAVLARQIDRMRLRVVSQVAAAERARAEATEARAVVEEQAEDLRRSNTELEQFAYVASHDLQEPLRKVASFCQLIERRYKGQLDERGEQYIEFAVDGAKRMQQLINDLLMFSRVGRQSTGFEEVDLEQVLAQALRQLEATISEAGAEVSHDPLPRIEGDHSLLVQLFQNLIGNGVKFRAEAPPRVHLSASRITGDGDVASWEFTCGDNGIGIEPQYADKIFVIFQRLHGRDVYAGTGIGLAMCKKIVEYHGGRLWLDTTRGDAPGAVFRWTLPERQGQTPERTMGDAAPEGPDNTDSADHTDHTDATSDSQNGDATVARAREDRGRTADDATV
jgi:signal transduction histidine kinase